jgi:hypothetical protein
VIGCLRHTGEANDRRRMAFHKPRSGGRPLNERWRATLTRTPVWGPGRMTESLSRQVREIRDRMAARQAIVHIRARLDRHTQAPGPGGGSGGTSATGHSTRKPAEHGSGQVSTPTGRRRDRPEGQPTTAKSPDWLRRGSGRQGRGGGWRLAPVRRSWSGAPGSPG